MPVNKDPSGKRSVQAEVEVPGTPEQVWQAIATGPGISSWFVPSTVDERVGGTASSNFGPGMESVAKIQNWEPPHRFVVETTEGPGAVATEWSVQALSGDTCKVRVVHSWFADSDNWDKEFEGHTYGWQAFFRILTIYLKHFRGLASAATQFNGIAPEPREKAWDTLTGELGFKGAAVGERRESPNGAPPLSGVVESIGAPGFPELLIRLDQPAPGTAHLFGMPMGGQVYLSMRLYLYGDQAPAAVTKSEPIWQAWIAKTFPPPAAKG